MSDSGKMSAVSAMSEVSAANKTSAASENIADRPADDLPDGLPGRESSVIPGRFGDPLTVEHARFSQFFDCSYFRDEPVFLLLHGWGSDENDMALFFSEYLNFPADYVSLRAPMQIPDFIGNTWFHECVPSGEDLDRDAYAAARAIDKWVVKNTEIIGSGRKIIPLGFSQGGTLAVSLLRIAPERYFAAASLSGFKAPGIVAEASPADSRLSAMKKPVFYGYGNSDNVISPDILRETGQWIELNAAADVHEYSMVHEICSKECSDLRSWFRSIL